MMASSCGEPTHPARIHAVPELGQMVPPAIGLDLVGLQHMLKREQPILSVGALGHKLNKNWCLSQFGHISVHHAHLLVLGHDATALLGMSALHPDDWPIAACQ
jgi:hypothetical protein